MVRFIIRSGYIPLDLQHAIYIPIWLDLLFVTPLSIDFGFLLFTFQYG